MSQIYGALNMAEASADRQFVNTIGQRVVYDAIGALLAQHNADLQAAMSVFLEGTTSEFKWRYKLPGGGYLQRRGGQGRVAAVKGYGFWDVALPLEDFGAGLISSEIELAYMSIKELDRHLDTIFMQNINTIRREMLVALFNNTTWSFKDDIQGTLSVVPLANQDGTLYPPAVGSENEAQDNHFLAAGYLEAAISDINNPFPVIKAELEEHFGKPTGGSSIVTFHNSTATSEIYALADFVEVDQKDLVLGALADRIVNLPSNMPGRILGKVDGVWAAEWDYIPTTYSLSINLEAPKPLFKRIDPADTGLGEGLQLVSTHEHYPFQDATYRNRLGFGVGNRLNGVVMNYTAGGFTVPASLAR